MRGWPVAPRGTVAARVAAGFFAAALLAFPTPAGAGKDAPDGGVASVLAPRLGLVSQGFNVDADGTLELVLRLPTDAAADPAATVVVTAHRAVRSRAAVADAVTGTLPRSVDTVDLSAATLTRPETDQVAVSIPLETDVRTADALQLPSAGLYPIVIEVRGGGEVLAELTTFVHRLPGPDEEALAGLAVVVAMTTSTDVTLDDVADVIVDPAVIAEYTHLAEVLEATAVPLTLRVSPANLAALSASGDEGAAVAARISAALDGDLRHELLSEPALPMDPSAAAAAGAGELYSQWLRDGEDLLVATSGASVRRTSTIVDQAISEGGAALLRDTGSRLLVLPVDVYDVLPDTFGGFTDSTLLVQLDVGAGATVDLAVVDRTADQTLARATATPALTAVLAVTDLLAAREEIEANGGDPRRHGLTLATPDLSLPNTETLGVISELLASTPGLQPTSLDELSVRADHLQYDGADVVVGLPAGAGADLGARVELADALRLEAVATGSMLPSADPRLARWSRQIDLLPTGAVDDAMADDIAESMRAEFDTVRVGVELPVGFSFTLTGRTSDVPLSLRNTSDGVLRVRVRLTSPKARFPDGDQLVELPPGTKTDFTVRIEARANGDFPVTLEVLTPEGDQRLGPLVPLRGSFPALSGLGQLVTGAALLVILTWWVRHMRQSRRVRAAGDAAERHPAAQPADADGDDGTASPAIDDEGLSPDAATSTLPHS